MINSNENQHADIYPYGCKLEEVEQFEYLGATLTQNGTYDQEVRIRLAQATLAMVRLTTIWKSTHQIQTKVQPISIIDFINIDLWL